MHGIHNLPIVFPKAIRFVHSVTTQNLLLSSISFASEIILKNWLLNPTGDPNSWVEIDLVQEHLNYWIKVLIELKKLSSRQCGSTHNFNN